MPLNAEIVERGIMLGLVGRGGKKARGNTVWTGKRPRSDTDPGAEASAWDADHAARLKPQQQPKVQLTRCGF